MTDIPELEAPVQRGSPLLGILGAATGAVIGAALWIQLILLIPDDWGELAFLTGFLVGPLSCLGYRLFRGLRSTRFAWNTVRLCCLLSPAPGLLCSLALSALRKGWPIGRLDVIFQRGLAVLPERETLGLLVLCALFLLVSAGLGRGLLVRYTDPAWYHDPRRLACVNGGGALFNHLPNQMLFAAGGVPPQFTVGKKLAVDGKTFTFRSFGKGIRNFSAEDIAGVIVGPSNGFNILYDRNNRALARFAWSMKGSQLLALYLLRRNIPFQDPAGAAVPLKTPVQMKRERIPKCFTVQESKLCLVVGWIGAVLFGVLSLACLVMVWAVDWVLLWCMAVFLILFALCLWTLSSYYRRRLEVDGEQLTYTTSLGRTTQFTISEVEKLSSSTLFGTFRLCTQDGRTLARFEDNMTNFQLLQLYLNQHLPKEKERN